MTANPLRPRTPVAYADALAWLSQRLRELPPERIPLAHAAGRVLAETIPPLPRPPEAAIDGHAIAAAAADGASDYAPLPLAATPVVAGDPLPKGADAVLPLQSFEHGCALAAIAPGHGVADPDPALIAASNLLTPLHLAALALRARTEILVRRHPRIALRVAGPKRGPDALTPMLAALLDAAGARLDENTPDLILLAGRSGPGPDDHAVDAFSPLAVGGVLMQPGETACLGDIDGVPALLLPGDPVAAAIAFALLAAPAIRRLAARPDPAPTTARLTRKIVSNLGQLDAVPVRLEAGQATPLPPLLSAIAAAAGLVLVPESSEGYPAGAPVAIYPLA